MYPDIMKACALKVYITLMAYDLYTVLYMLLIIINDIINGIKMP